MKYFNAKSAPTILTVVGLALGFLSFNFLASSNVFSALATMAFVAILAKAISELFRPGNEYGRILLRTLLVMFCFAIFMPAWAKAASAGRFEVGFDTHANGWLDHMKYLMMTAIVANPAVAVLKLLQYFIQRRKG